MGRDAPADAVALAALDALREAQVCRAGGLGSPENKRCYEDAMVKLRSLTAAREVFERLRDSRSPMIPRDITQDAALTMTVESWISLVAHYVNGYRLDSLRTSIVAPESYAVSFVNAANPHDEQVIEALAGSGDAAGRPTDDSVRSRALAQGVSPQVEVGIEIRMKYVDGAWRVAGISIGPVRSMPPQPDNPV